MLYIKSQIQFFPSYLVLINKPLISFLIPDSYQTTASWSDLGFRIGKIHESIHELKHEAETDSLSNLFSQQSPCLLWETEAHWDPFRCLWGGNYIHSNIKVLFAFSPSFPHECSVELSKAYMKWDVATNWTQKQIWELS